MSYSISASKAKVTHDTAMSIIEKEAKERASRTQHLRELRLAREAQLREEQAAMPSAKSPSRRKAG